MLVVTSIKDAQAVIRGWQKEGCSIGLVPTMGYLHAGHRSLIEKAVSGNDKVVVSIFVNPIQFGPNEDFSRYPRDMEKDKALCLEAGADLIFAPPVEEMYPTANLAYIDINDLDAGLCGSSRPGHFRGVCTVVAKLFNIVLPDRAYFGEKDAQQLLIIKRMVNDLNFNVEIIPCPIIRERDGLAMSSRNTYLSPEERTAALVISQSLREAKLMMENGERNALVIRDYLTGKISEEPLAKIDYVDIVDAETLEPVNGIRLPVLTAVAVFIGKTRLIDNFFFKEI